MSKKTPRDREALDHIQDRLWDKEKLAEATQIHCPEGMQTVPNTYVHEIEPGESMSDFEARLAQQKAGLVIPDEIGKPSFESDLYAHIREWWMRQANEDANLVIRKHGEYGDDSLATGGFALARLMSQSVTRARAQEIAIWHDLNVKLSRLENALKKGEEVGDDTWQDIACYAMMGRKAQQDGGWPYNKEE